MNSQVEIRNSFDSFDSSISRKQNNSSTSNTLGSMHFISRNEQQTESAKKVFKDDINLFFASEECYFLGEFQYNNISIIREYIYNKETCNQKIYHTHLKQKYSTFLQSQIIIAHGLYETSAHYMEIAFSLVDLGYEVHLFDFSGFGHSGGKRMNSNCKELQSDFITIYERLSHSRPIYVIACSIAVPIVLSCIILNPQTIKMDGFISYSAMMSIPRVYDQSSITSNAALYLLSKLNPIFSQMMVKLIAQRNQNEQKNCINENVIFKNRIGMAFELVKIQNFVLDNLSNVNLPLLILYGQEDQIVNQQDSITLYCKVGNLDKSIKILKDQQHLFLLDSNKLQVIDLIYQWIDVQSKHNKNNQNQLQDIITYTHTLPPILRIKQDFTSQIKAESKRQAPTEYNSGILSFCSNKSESSFPKNLSDDEISEVDNDESESESIKKMYRQQSQEKLEQNRKKSLSCDSIKSADSFNLNVKNEKFNKQKSPIKKKIKRVEEDCNICQKFKVHDYYNDSTSASYCNPFDPKAKTKQGKTLKCQYCCEQEKNNKKQKYVYGTYLAKSNLKQLIKFFVYAFFLVILKVLHKNSNILKLKTMRDIFLKYAQFTLSKLLKLQQNIIQ